MQSLDKACDTCFAGVRLSEGLYAYKYLFFLALKLGLLRFRCCLSCLPRGRRPPRSLASTQAWPRPIGRTATYATSGEVQGPFVLLLWRVLESMSLISACVIRCRWFVIFVLAPLLPPGCPTLVPGVPSPSHPQVCGVRSRQRGHGCGPVAVQGHGETRSPRRRGCRYENRTT